MPSKNILIYGRVRVAVEPRAFVEQRAVVQGFRRHSVETEKEKSLNYQCLRWVRHARTNYERLISAAKSLFERGEVSGEVFEAIGAAYPWLAEECIEEHLRRAARGCYGNNVRIIVERDDGNQSLEQDIYISTPSLSSDRFIYLPPFLPQNEIKARRFNDHESMSDRWWEWEAELGKQSTVGRPDDPNWQW